MARKAGQWEEEEVAQSHEEEERRQPAMKRRCRVTGSCFSLSLSIPILDCHHTWCCCGTPSDFYCATQT
ncbi:hypothetical protein STEG23_008676, partial [Scotinomys teguina]